MRAWVSNSLTQCCGDWTRRCGMALRGLRGGPRSGWTGQLPTQPRCRWTTPNFASLARIGAHHLSSFHRAQQTAVLWPRCVWSSSRRVACLLHPQLGAGRHAPLARRRAARVGSASNRVSSWPEARSHPAPATAHWSCTRATWSACKAHLRRSWRRRRITCASRWTVMLWSHARSSWRPGCAVWAWVVNTPARTTAEPLSAIWWRVFCATKAFLVS
mmetsp:Transcript_563/g.1570  ORF Transcript_563/g.1570 Transcript_563/m.1570 type:complete len:216 (+) Transcript_563:347-994(+)